MGYDAGKSKDAYLKMIEQQELYTQQLSQKVKGEMKSDCDEAEETMDNSYADYTLARNIFSGCSDEKSTLEANLRKLQEEKQAKINNLIRNAKLEGKTDAEIALLCDNINSEYAGKIANMQFNISRMGATTLLKQKTMAEADSTYRNSRFGNIAATNNYLSGLSSLFSAYLDLGKMQQNQAFLEQQKGWLG